MISVSHVSKVVGDASGPLAILRDIDFSVNVGESVAILGASGSGKSTLLSIMAGLDTPTQGQVVLAGQRIFELTEDQITQSGKVKFSANLRSKTVDIIDSKTNKNVAKVYLGLESFGTPGMTNALETLVCINADKLAKKDVVNYLKNPTSSTAIDIIIGDLLTSENLTSTDEFAERALHQSDPGKWAVNRILKTLPKELGNLKPKELAQVNATIVQTTTTYFTPEAFSGGDPSEFNTEDFNYALGQTVGLLIPGVLNGPGLW